MVTFLKHPLKCRRNMYFPVFESRGRLLTLSYGKMAEARSLA